MYYDRLIRDTQFLKPSLNQKKPVNKSRWQTCPSACNDNGSGFLGIQNMSLHVVTCYDMFAVYINARYNSISKLRSWTMPMHHSPRLELMHIMCFSIAGTMHNNDVTNAFTKSGWL